MSGWRSTLRHQKMETKLLGCMTQKVLTLTLGTSTACKQHDGYEDSCRAGPTLTACRQYHKSILFLFTNFLPNLHTSDPWFHICAQSATSVCTAYKGLNQNKTLTYTMISLHSCFVAGLTLIYCVWRDRSLFSYEILEATRDCSQSLTIFGEKWPGAVKYRDNFDELSGNLLKSIVNPAPALQPRDRLRQSQVRPDAGSDKVLTQAQQTQQTNHLQTSIPPHQSANVIETPMISDAVREGLEVDEEAPGGWQGLADVGRDGRRQCIWYPRPSFGLSFTWAKLRWYELGVL